MQSKQNMTLTTCLIFLIEKRLRCLVIDETIDGRYNPLKRQGYKRVLRAICKLKHRGKFVQVRASSCKFVQVRAGSCTEQVRASSCKFVQVRDKCIIEDMCIFLTCLFVKQRRGSSICNLQSACKNVQMLTCSCFCPLMMTSKNHS